MRAASIWRLVIQPASMLFSPYSPNWTLTCARESPARRPRCCLRCFTRFGESISYHHRSAERIRRRCRHRRCRPQDAGCDSGRRNHRAAGHGRRHPGRPDHLYANHLGRPGRRDPLFDAGGNHLGDVAPAQRDALAYQSQRPFLRPDFLGPGLEFLGARHQRAEHYSIMQELPWQNRPLVKRRKPHAPTPIKPSTSRNARKNFTTNGISVPNTPSKNIRRSPRFATAAHWRANG